MVALLSYVLDGSTERKQIYLCLLIWPWSILGHVYLQKLLFRDDKVQRLRKAASDP